MQGRCLSDARPLPPPKPRWFKGVSNRVGRPAFGRMWRMRREHGDRRPYQRGPNWAQRRRLRNLATSTQQLAHRNLCRWIWRRWAAGAWSAQVLRSNLAASAQQLARLNLCCSIWTRWAAGTRNAPSLRTYRAWCLASLRGRPVLAAHRALPAHRALRLSFLL